METVTIPVELVAECYFYIHLPHKSLTFWKNYLWASLSLHFQTALKSLVSYWGRYYLLRRWCIVGKIYYFILIVSYLNFFNSFISINEIGKYLSQNNV